MKQDEWRVRFVCNSVGLFSLFLWFYGIGRQWVAVEVNHVVEGERELKFLNGDGG